MAYSVMCRGRPKKTGGRLGQCLLAARKFSSVEVKRERQARDSLRVRATPELRSRPRNVEGIETSMHIAPLFKW
jgi:hypothetical protein